MNESISSEIQATPPAYDLSALFIPLLKGVQYREADERAWAGLLTLQARMRETAALLNLELVLDEAEGYAFLKSRPEPAEDDPAPRLPRLMARRPLSYAVSLVLALLRKKLAEFDAGGGDTRLVLTLEQIVELVRVFLPDGSNEAKLIDGLETTLNKIEELGFVRKLKPASGSKSGPAHYEVRRILKAFVDAQWLAEFDTRLANYRGLLGQTDASKGSADE